IQVGAEFQAEAKEPAAQAIPSDSGPGEAAAAESAPLPTPPEEAPPPAESSSAPKRMTFNPLANLAATEGPGAGQPAPELESDKTQVFSPIDLLAAAKIINEDISQVPTKAILHDPAELVEQAPPAAPSIPGDS